MKLLIRNLTNFYYITIVISFILLIITMSNVSLLYYPQDPFYYIKSLPFYYWLGLLLLSSNIILIIKYYNLYKSQFKPLFIIIITSLYVQSIPILDSEMPRYIDVFLHGSESFPILSTGYISQQFSYSNEYPIAFILLAELLMITNLNILLFFKIFELLFTTILLPILIYLITRAFNTRFAFLSSIIFVGLFWTGEGHFSPQAISFIFYSIFILLFVRTYLYNNKNKYYTVLLIITSLIIIMTNPTNSFFLVFSLVLFTIVMLLRDRINTQYYVRLLLLLFIMIVSWYSYNATSFTLDKIIDLIKNQNPTQFYIKLTPQPAESYTLVNYLRAYEALVVFLSGIMISLIFIIKGNKNKNQLVLGSMFLSIMINFISVLNIETFLIGRNYNYALFIWPALILYYLQNTKKYREICIMMFIFFVIFALVTNPITRYGREPLGYIQSSLYITIDNLVKHTKSDNIRFASIDRDTFVYKYFMSKYKNNLPAYTELRFKIEKTLRGIEEFSALENDIERLAYIPNTIIFISNYSYNNLYLKYNMDKWLEVKESNIINTTNMISNSGHSRIYLSKTT